MRPYLEGYRFSVVTDHQALKWLQSIEDPSGRLARWSLALQQFDFEIRYRKGAHNLVADALSRQPEVNEVTAGTGCPWYDQLCQRVQENPPRHPEYKLQEGRLYRYIPDQSGLHPEAEWKLCIPKTQRHRILVENHDAPTAGHLGISKTIARISRHYFWPKMGRDTAKHIRQCRKCLQYKAQQRAPAGKMQVNRNEGLWDTVSADLVGPLPRSTHGHTMLAVFQDRFSKWVELHPLRQATAPAVTKAFRERILLRFGCPRRVITDNGRQFESREFTGLLDEYGIHHRRTPPYTPQCNPVERTNRVVKTMIAQLTEHHHREWDRWLPEIMFAYNVARHDATQQSPAYLNFGREPAVPGSLYRATTEGTEDRQEQIARLRDAVTLARNAQARASEAQRKGYNQHRSDWEPQVTEWVMLREHPLSSAAKEFCAKLAPKYAGPYQISDLIGRNMVLLRRPGRRPIRAHLQDLKPCGRVGDKTEVPLDAHAARHSVSNHGREKTATSEAAPPAAKERRRGSGTLGRTATPARTSEPPDGSASARAAPARRPAVAQHSRRTRAGARTAAEDATPSNGRTQGRRGSRGEPQHGHSDEAGTTNRAAGTPEPPRGRGRPQKHPGATRNGPRGRGRPRKQPGSNHTGAKATATQPHTAMGTATSRPTSSMGRRPNLRRDTTDLRRPVRLAPSGKYPGRRADATGEPQRK